MEVAYSAPGKALIAGGYLVLDTQYSGFVTALSTRMHCKLNSFSPNEKSSNDSKTSTITVRSPQFANCKWDYQFDVPFKGIEDVSKSENKFLVAVLNVILAYVEPKSQAHLELEIFSDKGYHSGGHAVVGDRFLSHNAAIDDVPKTGLGSSAGLVTVVSACLVKYFTGSSDLRTIHNLAQISHCWAQGKVGSGFDVAAAVYGSIVYRRFAPQIVTKVLDSSVVEHPEILRKTVDSQWEMVVEKCDLPKGVRLLMGDVHSGSDTRGMVAQVRQWQQNSPAAARKLFDSLNEANMELVKCLKHVDLTKDVGIDVSSYSLIQLKHMIKMCRFNNELLESVKPVLQVVEAISRVRQCLQLLTKQSGAPVEPSEQTVLLDNCYMLPGVLGGVVPGAGGYDAICLIVAEKSVASIENLTKGKKVEHFDSGMDIPKVDLDSLDRSLFARVEWLDLHEESVGLKEEKSEIYKGW